MDYVKAVLKGLDGIDELTSREVLYNNLDSYRASQMNNEFSLRWLAGDLLAINLRFARAMEEIRSKFDSYESVAESFEIELLKLHDAFVEYYALNQSIPQALAYGDMYSGYMLATLSSSKYINGRQFHGVAIQHERKKYSTKIAKVETNGGLYYGDNYIRDDSLDIVCSSESEPVIRLIFSTKEYISQLGFVSLLPVGAGLKSIRTSDGAELIASYQLDYAGTNIICFEPVITAGLELSFSVPNNLIVLSDVYVSYSEYAGALNVMWEAPDATAVGPDGFALERSILRYSAQQRNTFVPAVYTPRLVWYE